MNLYLEDFALGLKQAMADHEQGHNIFEIKGGSLFPNQEHQKSWGYSKTKDMIHFNDGNHTYTFKGELDPEKETYLEKQPDVPLPDMFNNSTEKGKAQVHRANPGCIYFTLQEGKLNPTYTFRHSGDSKWVAVPKPRKAKKQMKEEPFIPNVNLETVKEGMEQEFTNLFNETKGESLGFFKQALVGEALQGLANLPARLALAPARIGGPESPVGYLDPMGTENTMAGLENAATAGLAGAGLGAGYHVLKRKLYNTPEENTAEDQDEGTLQRRMLMPAGIMAGANLAGRAMFPGAVNNPDWRMFG